MSTTTRCARCGREIEAGSYLCAKCREEEGPSIPGVIKPPTDLEERASRWPPWMPKPSPVQYHATIFVTIFLVLVGLGVFAFISHQGVGPFVGHAVRFRQQPPASLVVDAVVRNDGSKTARANCRIVAYDRTFLEGSREVLTAEIPPGGSVHFRRVVQGVQATPTAVQVNCS